MPIIAIGAAIASVSAVGAAGFGAVLAGTATLGTTFAAVAAVGATLGAIGEVAGIKELKTAGMVIGGIGGIGSLANAVGAFGEGATLSSVFGGGTGEAAGGGDFIGAGAKGIINGEATGIGGVGEAAGGGDFIGTTMDSTTGQIIAQSNNLDVISAAAKLGGLSPQSATAPNAMAGAKTDAIQQKLSSATPIASQAKSSVDDYILEGPDSSTNTGTGVVPKANNAGTSVTGTVNGPPTTAKLGDEWTNPDTGANFSYDGKQWAAKPGFWGSNTGAMLGMGVLQSAGSFLSGAFDEVKPAQAAAYNAQAAANNAQAALAQKELSNMNGRIPTARRMGVTGQTSLINPGRAA